MTISVIPPSKLDILYILIKFTNLRQSERYGILIGPRKHIQQKNYLIFSSTMNVAKAATINLLKTMNPMPKNKDEEFVKRFFWIHC